jgi:hypothetical protein
VPFRVPTIPDHEVIEVSRLRPYQPYDHLILRDAPAGRTTWTVLDCERQGDAWQVTATRCLKTCRVHRRASSRRLPVAGRASKLKALSKSPGERIHASCVRNRERGRIRDPRGASSLHPGDVLRLRERTPVSIPSVTVNPVSYLDTSAINRLEKDPARDRIVDRLLARGPVLVSAINVVELGSTADPGKRVRLLETAKLLAERKRPAALPQELLARSLNSYRRGHRNVEGAIRHDLDGLWYPLESPCSVDDAHRLKLVAYKESQESWYRKMHDEARSFVQADFTRLSDADRRKVSNAARFLKSCAARPHHLESNLAASFAAAGSEWDFTGHAQVFTDLEPWMFYFGAIAVGVFDRAIKASGFGWPSNAQGLDTQQAIYLAFCSTFVTADLRQARVIRILSCVGHRPRRVVSYDRLREELLGPEAVRIARTRTFPTAPPA